MEERKEGELELTQEYYLDKEDVGFHLEERKNLLEKIGEVYRIHYPHYRRITDNGACEFKTIFQLGAHVFESKKITHFVMPTEELITSLTPYEYKYMIATYNPADTRFSGIWSGTEVGCCKHVIRLQEELYSFDFNIYETTRKQLLGFQERAYLLSAHFSDYENNSYQNEIYVLQKEIRKELGLPEEND